MLFHLTTELHYSTKPSDFYFWTTYISVKMDHSLVIFMFNQIYLQTFKINFLKKLLNCVENQYVMNSLILRDQADLWLIFFWWVNDYSCADAPNPAYLPLALIFWNRRIGNADLTRWDRTWHHGIHAFDRFCGDVEMLTGMKRHPDLRFGFLSKAVCPLRK